MTPQEKTIMKANFILAAIKLGATFDEATQAYIKLTLGEKQ